MGMYRPLRFLGFPLLVLLIGLSATALVAAQLKRIVEVQDRQRFLAATDALQDSIRDRLETYLAMLQAGSGLFAAGSLSTPAEFRAFTDRLELRQRYPGIQGIGFSARLRPHQLAQVTAAQRRAGTEGFEVWPAGPRAEYHAILYLEPMDRRNRAAIGYDMFTEATRRAAMERARDSGEPTASGPVVLVQEIDEARQPGFLIYVPVYEGGTVPATIGERRASLVGYIYSPFRAGDLFAGILGRNPHPRVAFDLFDGKPSPQAVLHRAGTEGRTGRFSDTRTLRVAGREWTAQVVSAPGLDESSSLMLLPFVLVGGLGITGLLVALALLQTRARLRAEASEAAAEDASRRFQQLANSIPQLAWMARPDGWIYWYNDRWYAYTGTTPEQMAGWGWQTVHDPEELPRVRERWQLSLRTGEPFEMEFPLRGADGRFRVFLTRVVPFRDVTGTIVQWFGTNTDVQHLRDAERSLQEQADTLAALNRTGAKLVSELDLNRLLQAVTDAGTQLTRAHFGAFFYNTINDLGESYTLYVLSGVPREAFARFPMPRNTAVFGPTFRGESVLRSDDITRDPRYGRNAPYAGMPPGHLPVRSYLAAPVRSRSGEVLGGLFFGHPEPGVFTPQAEAIVTGIAAQAAIAIDNARLYGQVQRLFESEREARAAAERVSSLKDEFLATLSHELRTPLNAVLGWARMLSLGTLPEEKRQQATDTILRNALMQSQLVEDLLDMSRIVSGRLHIQMGEVDLREVVSAAAAVVAPTAAAKHVTLDLAGGEGSCTVSGDPNRLQQVMWNLLNNAIKFTPSGGRVEVRLTRVDGHVEIAVADTGVGIDPAFLPHVFERFRQGDGASSGGLGGLGLGLSIVRSLVEMHAGTVRAASAGPNQGAVFTVTLPAMATATSHSADADRVIRGS